MNNRIQAMPDIPNPASSSAAAKAGDVVFFHYLTLHGSMPNRSDKLRKTVLCQLYAGNDQVEQGNQHPNEKLVLKGRNRVLSRSGAAQQ